ncbi:MAG: caspase family protein [Rhizonema sp. PD38]|nr:caspase family protein [Rhizonema sp. PD38]
MGRNWAIVIGINHYENLRSLKYAKQDALLMETWFKQEAFDQVFLFTEDSPPIVANPPIPTQPTFGHLRRFLRAQFENTQQSLLKPEDNLWFFFAGHGNRYRDQDYLMFSDSDPGDVEHTALSVDYVTQRLRRSGADNVVLFLDACRDEGSRAGLGIGEQRHQGVITFYSCTANQQSWEIDELQHGVFTHTLLEGLRLQGEANCATVERLEQHLRHQVPLLNTRYGKPAQNPYLQAEPPYKIYFILREQAARLRDVQPLKYEASLAENKGNLSLARQLWVRVLAASRGDWDAVDAIERIAIRQRENSEPVIPSEPVISSPTGKRSITSEPAQESQIAQSEEEYQQNLVRYQQAFYDAIEQEFPLNEATRHELRQLQESLQLTNDEILQIEQPILTQKQTEHKEQLQQYEVHQQNLVRYQQAFSEIIERNFPLSQATRSELKQWQQSLQLTNDEIAQIEQPLVTQKQAEYERRQEEQRRQHSQQLEYQQKLQQYEQELIKTVEAGHSLDSDDVRQRLRQFRRNLGLKDADTPAIEARVAASAETVRLPSLTQQPGTDELSKSNLLQIVISLVLALGAGLLTLLIQQRWQTISTLIQPNPFQGSLSPTVTASPSESFDKLNKGSLIKTNNAISLSTTMDLTREAIAPQYSLLQVISIDPIDDSHSDPHLQLRVCQVPATSTSVTKNTKTSHIAASTPAKPSLKPGDTGSTYLSKIKDSISLSPPKNSNKCPYNRESSVPSTLQPGAERDSP